MKKKSHSLLPLFLLLLLLSACAGTAPRTADTRIKPDAGAVPPAADLSRYRPKFSLPGPGAGSMTGKELAAGITPANHVNGQVAALLDTVARRNKSVRYAKGYRILAYSGSGRKAWLDMRDAIVKRVPEERDYPIYTQPNYRLKIGDYFTRVEAQQVLLRIRDISPNAMIIADQINVK